MPDPIYRSKKWYWETKDGDWLAWVAAKSNWEKVDRPPPPDPPSRPWIEALGEPFRKAPLILATAVITSLLIPFISRPWQDRAKESELKSTLTTHVGEAGADALSSGRLLMLRLLPEAQKERRLEERLGRLRKKDPRPQKQIRSTRKELREADDLAFNAQATRFNQAREDWLRISATNRTRFRAYFQDNEEQASAWSDLRANILGFLRLTADLPSSQRREEVLSLRSDLEEYGQTNPQGQDRLERIDWDLLEEGHEAVVKDPDRTMQEKREAMVRYFESYELVGRMLETKLDDLTTQILAANSTAYSSCIIDFNWLHFMCPDQPTPNE